MDIQMIIDDYRGTFGVREGFTNRLERYIGEKLAEEGIKIQLIESRTKKVDSYISKVERKIQKSPEKKEHILDNLDEYIIDSIGVRVVVLYLDDVDTVCNFLGSLFTVYPEKCEDKLSSMAVNEFGYISTHMVYSIGKELISEDSWCAFKNYIFEVQVRTLLQHVWALNSHGLVYKHNIKDKYMREINRLAALMESMDKQLMEIKNNIYSQDEEELTEKKLAHELLTSESLSIYLIHSKSIKRINEGLRHNPIFQFRNDMVATIKRLLTIIGVETLQECRDVFSENIDRITCAMDIYIDSIKFRKNSFDAVLVMAILIVFQDKIEIENEVSHWKKRFQQAILNAADEYKKKKDCGRIEVRSLKGSADK